jgi:hypothetical protein
MDQLVGSSMASTLEFSFEGIAHVQDAHYSASMSGLDLTPQMAPTTDRLMRMTDCGLRVFTYDERLICVKLVRVTISGLLQIVIDIA